MQLEQGLFMLHRSISERISYKCLILLSLFLLVTLSSFIISLLSSHPLLDVSSCFTEYYNLTHTMNSTTTYEEWSDSLRLVNSTTILSIYVMDAPSCRIFLNRTGHTTHESMHIGSNLNLLYMNQSSSFLLKHNISRHEMYIPLRSLSLSAIYMNDQLSFNEFYLISLLESVSSALQSIAQKYAVPFNESTPVRDELILDGVEIRSHLQWGNQIVDDRGIGFLNYRMAYPLTIWMKFYEWCRAYSLLAVVNVFMGLLVRSMVMLAITVLSLLGGRGWVQPYITMVINRFHISRYSSLKMLAGFGVAVVGFAALLTMGLGSFAMDITHAYLGEIDNYWYIIFKNLFIIQVAFYFFIRSRTSLRFYPILSFMVAQTILYGVFLHPFRHTLLLLNIHLVVQLLIIVGFFSVEKHVMEGSKGNCASLYSLSVSKPRMMFYAGYEINWERGFPPLWTYFTRWYDYQCFSKGEKCYVERDYELLYGKMLGMNQRIEVPQDPAEESAQRLFGNER